MSSSTQGDAGTTDQTRMTGHLQAALEEADNENLRFHIRQALQFAAKDED